MSDADVEEHVFSVTWPHLWGDLNDGGGSTASSVKFLTKETGNPTFAKTLMAEWSDKSYRRGLLQMELQEREEAVTDLIEKTWKSTKSKATWAKS